MIKLLKNAGIITLMTTVFWNQPIYRRYKINSHRMLTGLKVIYISDLHNAAYGKDGRKLLTMIAAEAPHLIFFGGDIADEKSSYHPVRELLFGLEGKYPMYYVSGNHEYWMDDTEDVHQMFRDYGVRVLMDETVQITTEKGPISMVGLKDPDSVLQQSDKNVLTRALKATYQPEKMHGYRILLSHRPEHIGLYMKYDFDLILSGHAHGGQVRIPGILNGLYAPNQGFLPKYAGGHYKVDKTDFIVSRGLSYRPKLPRIMNPPELLVLEFE